jgi:hypothetical protein
MGKMIKVEVANQTIFFRLPERRPFCFHAVIPGVVVRMAMNGFINGWEHEQDQVKVHQQKKAVPVFRFSCHVQSLSHSTVAVPKTKIAPES